MQSTVQLQKNSESMKFGTYSRMAIISIVVLVAIIIISGSFRPPVSEGFVFREAPLAKVSALLIQPNEGYVYLYTINNTNNTLTFLTRQGPTCVFIQVLEAVNQTGTCLKTDGTDQDESNVTLRVSYISLFKPWMLAVHDDWKWNVTMGVLISDQFTPVKTFLYQTLASELVFGRESYVVRISGTDDNESQEVVMWIDKEKRIILKEKGPQYEVNLIKGPFELTN